MLLDWSLVEIFVVKGGVVRRYDSKKCILEFFLMLSLVLDFFYWFIGLLIIVVCYSFLIKYVFLVRLML